MLCNIDSSRFLFLVYVVMPPHKIVVIFLYQVVEIDGRIIGDGRVGPVTQRLQIAYKELTSQSGVLIPTYQET